MSLYDSNVRAGTGSSDSARGRMGASDGPVRADDRRRQGQGGRTDPRLYALGDLAGGSLFFTFGMPSLVDRARDIVEDLQHSDQVRGSSLLAGDTLQIA
jgi:hypothetical protein